MELSETSTNIGFEHQQPASPLRGDPGRRLIAVIGGLLIAAYIVQLVVGLPSPIDQEILKSLSFRVISGSLLLLYLGAQMYVPWLRFSRRFSDAQKNIPLHEAFGLVGLILLYVHAPRPGPGYLSILSAAMLANIAFGIFSSTSRRSRHRVVRLTWLASHIVCSSFLVILALFHVGHALYYE